MQYVISYLPYICVALAVIGAVYSVLRLKLFIQTEREYVHRLAEDQEFRAFVYQHQSELDPKDEELQRMTKETQKILLDILVREAGSLEPAKRRPIDSALHQPYEPSRRRYAAKLANEGRKLVFQH